jgi:hypothetical protein
MKKSIVASIIGVVATVAAVETSYGQGSVFFNNYSSSATGALVTDQQTGLPISTGWTAGLYYGFGTLTDPAQLTLLNLTKPFGTGGLAGYFGYDGTIASIPGYLPTTGAITFMVVAYNGADWASSGGRGQSALFTLPSIATGTSPVGEFGPGFTAFQVAVPEPSTFALIGLGTGVLLFLRRRK